MRNERGMAVEIILLVSFLSAIAAGLITVKVDHELTKAEQREQQLEIRDVSITEQGDET